MSDQVENQIVSMQFDNKQFESGVATSIGSLDKLKTSLQFKNAGTGLDDIQNKANSFNLLSMSENLAHVVEQFKAVRFAARIAFATIVRQGVYAAERIAKSFTIDPIKAGFSNYETKINAVQTILANTADQGTNLKDVTKQLNELNTYANKTVYNFADMAKNIGTFTAAGVDLKTSTESIKGIANLAALSGAGAEKASGAMYQLSQAIAAGKVNLQDWNSVNTAGIGGAVFQKSLINAALATGSLDKSQVHLGKTMADTTVNGVSFRNSLSVQPGQTAWLTSGVLTKSLGTFTGDMTKAQLASQGFTKEQIKSIQAQAKTAVNAATQIKTFSQLFQALKEEVATAYASVFEALFGNIKEAKKFLSPLHTFIENALTKPIYEVAAALKSWRKLGGFDDLVVIFKNLATIVGNLLYPFKLLFSAILPDSKNAGKGLEGFTKTLAKITGVIANVTSVTRKLGVVMKPIGKAFGVLSSLAGAFLNALKPLLPIVDKLGNYVSGLFDQGMSMAGNLVSGWIAGLDPAALKKAAVNLADSWVQWIKNALGIHSPAKTMIPIGLNIVQGIVSGLSKGAQLLIAGLQQLFIGMGKALKYLVTDVDWGAVGHVINEGLFIAVALAFRNFIKSFTGTIGAFKSLIGKGGEVLEQLTSNLKTMQQKVKSEIIRNIAISVALLAGAALLLSTINAKKLGLAIGAIGGLMASLVASMTIMTRGANGKLSVKDTLKQMGMLNSLSKALVSFSTAILILSAAVALMGQLDPKTIERGLAGVAGVIALIVTSTAILSKTGGGATILATATAMLIMSASLTAFVGVMKLYEKLDWKTLVRGGGAAAAVIVAVGLAMRAFGKGSIGGAVGLVVASAALVVLAKAMQMLASIGLGDMIKSVVALDVILGSLAAAAAAMSASEGGAGSMLIMAAAIIILAEALKILSKIPMLDLLKAIGALVISLALIAGAAIVLAPAVPLIAALGSAVLLLGVAVLAAGIGILAFATAMGILAVVGPAAFQAIADGIGQLLDVLPKIGEALGKMVVSFFTGIVEAAGPLTKALGKLLGILIDAVTALIPKIKKLIQKLINAILNVIGASEAHAAKVMIKFVLRLLDALSDGVPKMIKKGTDLIVGVIQGLSNADARIVTASAKAVLHFLRAIDKAITKYEQPIIEEGKAIAGHLVTGLVKGLINPAALSSISSAAKGLADKAKSALGKAWKILSPSKVTQELGGYFSEGAAIGISDKAHLAQRSAEDMANKAFNAIKMTFSNSKKATDGLIDTRPKITPILDLTQLERDASQISAKMGSHSIKANISRNQASTAASEQTGRKGSGGTDKAGDAYTFNQVINSPKPVNPVKVYRGTKSQIALLKEVTGR